MKIVFFGTPEFATRPLKALIEKGYSVIAVVTQPDSLLGRKKLLTSPAVKLVAQEHQIPVFQPENLKSEEFFETFKNLNSDICIVGGYGNLIPPRYLEVPKFGFLCIHPSILPKYRGPSPVQGAILNGDRETGVTIMVIDKEMDHGPIVSIEKYALSPDIFKEEAEKEMWDLGAKLLIKTLPKYISREVVPQPQDHNQATFTKLLTRTEGRIDWSKSAQEIYNQIRALNPEPGTWTMWNDKIINIKSAESIEGKLTLSVIQIEGKKETTLAEFLHGHPDFNVSQLK
ncbi:MAG: methionyl-tRNA formyltransferase [Patescibacteria group bacterium]